MAGRKVVAGWAAEHQQHHHQHNQHNQGILAPQVDSSQVESSRVKSSRLDRSGPPKTPCLGLRHVLPGAWR